jgi:hypothetical protein
MTNRRVSLRCALRVAGGVSSGSMIVRVSLRRQLRCSIAAACSSGLVVLAVRSVATRIGARPTDPGESVSDSASSRTVLSRLMARYAENQQFPVRRRAAWG